MLLSMCSDSAISDVEKQFSIARQLFLKHKFRRLRLIHLQEVFWQTSTKTSSIKIPMARVIDNLEVDGLREEDAAKEANAVRISKRDRRWAIFQW